jgi:hypothetical protein
MRPAIPLLALLQVACAAVPDSSMVATPAQRQVFSRSHNRSDVDVYLLCGNRDAVWLGTVAAKGEAGLEIPADRPTCVPGLHFFLVVRNVGRGYWVGPVRPRAGAPITLVIEKYAGLSAARVQ